MPIPSEGLVRQILAASDRGTFLRQAMINSWNNYQKNYPDRGWWRRKSTRAAVVWEHWVQNAISLLEDDTGFKPVTHDDTISMIFDQRVLVRLKKADIQLRSSNYPTLMARLFHTHEELLPGFEDLHRVEAAYVLNQFGTAVDWIGIVARDRRRHLWHFELEGANNVEKLPLPGRGADTAAHRVMRPKLPSNRKSEDETE